MNIPLSGSHGLVGSALIPSLISEGHRIIRLIRSRSAAGQEEISWDPAAGKIDATRREGFGGVIHLAGENIATGRWTAAKKARIRDSRVQGTRLLCENLAQLETPPSMLLCASAVGYYGDRGDEILTEENPPGKGFLAEVCQEWEAATEPARQRGIRVVNLRFGVILSATEGALAAMLPIFKAGIGGSLGTGQQYLSWVTLEDVVGIVHHALRTETLHGPVNAVAPQTVTNRDFTQTLGKVLRRPTFLSVPAFMIRLVLGEMADGLLASVRAHPSHLLENGYVFHFPELEPALQHLLGKKD